ncbi:hypothetical protein MNBD_ALPHA07-1775 [hydrothermal vent metagenome]|uniref:Uncharacterized protein n=1 Tax=hydrothermal vent metagenome TaxID=652676 RepID=A0A3B0SSY0_9ZZZZ
MSLEKITINDTEFVLDDMNEEAKAQLEAIVYTDAYIKNLRNRISMAETAKIAYLKALKHLTKEDA